MHTGMSDLQNNSDHQKRNEIAERSSLKSSQADAFHR